MRSLSALPQCSIYFNSNDCRKLLVPSHITVLYARLFKRSSGCFARAYVNRWVCDSGPTPIVHTQMGPHQRSQYGSASAPASPIRPAADSQSPRRVGRVRSRLVAPLVGLVMLLATPALIQAQVVVAPGMTAGQAITNLVSRGAQVARLGGPGKESYYSACYDLGGATGDLVFSVRSDTIDYVHWTYPCTNSLDTAISFVSSTFIRGLTEAYGPPAPTPLAEFTMLVWSQNSTPVATLFLYHNERRVSFMTSRSASKPTPVAPQEPASSLTDYFNQLYREQHGR